MARRPFGSDAKLLFAARNEWFGLTEADWLEAFSHHPRIGDRAALEARFPTDARPVGERAGRRRRGGDDVLTALAEAQRRLRRSLRIHLHRVRDGEERGGDAGAAPRAFAATIAPTELRIAAEEQAKITALRLSG